MPWVLDFQMWTISDRVSVAATGVWHVRTRSLCPQRVTHAGVTCSDTRGDRQLTTKQKALKLPYTEFTKKRN